MKQILLTFFTLFILQVNAQYLIEENSHSFVNRIDENRIINNENYERGSQIVHWSNDFSDDTTWVSTSEFGEYGWQLTDSESGWAYNNAGLINSTSGGEYAFVWNGDPTDALVVLQAGYYDLTTQRAIDISDIESAVLEFELFGARFTDSLLVQLSYDGTDFFTVGDNSDIDNLTSVSGGTTANPTLRSHNITLDVQSQDSLYIRFNHQTISTGINTGVCYGWFIDDVKIVIPEDNNLALDNVYTGDVINDYEYTITPIEQVHALNLGVDVTNLGGLEAVNTILTAEVFIDGGETPVYTGTSDPVNITQGEQTTIFIATDYTPSTIGTYTVNYSVETEGTDADPTNNIGTKEFQIDEYFFANDDYNDLTEDFDGSLNPDILGPDDEWLVGTTFTCFQEGSSIESVAVSFADGTVPTELGVVIYDFDTSGGAPFDFETLAFNDVDLTQAHLDEGGFTVFELDDQIDMDVETTYLVMIYHEGESGSVIFNASEGDNDFSTWIRGDYNGAGNLGFFTFSNVSPAIRLGTSDYLTVNELGDNSTIEIGQNFPNPFTDKTSISYNLKEATDIVFSISDVTGKTVFTKSIGRQSSGKHILELTDLELTSGVYNYTFDSEMFSVTKTFIRN